MASLVSFIRSAARATSSAPRRLPIRWRLAGGSALLTLVILLAFALVVGGVTARRADQDFQQRTEATATNLAGQLAQRLGAAAGAPLNCAAVRDVLSTAAVEGAVVQLVVGRNVQCTEGAPGPGPGARGPGTGAGDLYRGATRVLPITVLGEPVALGYFRPISEVRRTVRRLEILLGLSVLGGAALALLAGLAVARRAMAPIADLTSAAREIQRTRDPGRELPRPAADDEVAELARTLEDMLRALDEAQDETEAALDHQRAFVADASHELRTPLTSVLANLELLVDHLDGEPREVAASALRSSQRMRRLVADLLLLARADAQRTAAHAPLDLRAVLVDAAGELEPVAAGHLLTLDLPDEPVEVLGARDEVHRLVLNLLGNAVTHTPAGTRVRGSVRAELDGVVLEVEDDGPGVPARIAPRIFERFVRGGGVRADSGRGGSSGLGLAIVRAVAEAHGGSVALSQPAGGAGARFVVRLPPAGRTVGARRLRPRAEVEG